MHATQPWQPPPALRPIAAAPPQASSSYTSAPPAANAGKRKHGAAAKGKGKQKEEDHNDEEEGDDEEGRELKRNRRMALSCRECKRRKVKCDRTMPACGPCSSASSVSPSSRKRSLTRGLAERGQASGCTWDAFSTEGYLPPTLARTSDLSAVTSRLQHIEAFLARLPPNLASFTPYVPPAPPSTALEDPNRKTPVQGAGEGVQEETWSDTEDAAVDLEDGVFGQVAANAAAESPETKTRLGTNGRGGGTTGGKLRFGGRDMELTKALTSIVSPERVGPASKVHLDVEFDASPAEVERARLEVLGRIYRALPTREAVTHLVHLYFSRVSWLFHHIQSVIDLFSCFLDSFDKGSRAVLLHSLPSSKPSMRCGMRGGRTRWILSGLLFS